MASRNLLLMTAFALLLGLQTQPVLPHSGGTNSEGCHTNHKTGEYHCHTPRTPAPGSTTYCHVINGQQRCGYSRSTCYNLVSTYGGYCQQE